jgi:mRNA-degrading endonuclease toxin of MazEF toxin-antitoxin module
MSSEYDSWNNLKKNISIKNRLNFNVGEIWMTSLGKNIGVEEDGKGVNFLRPVLVLKKFNSDFFIGIPLSNTDKSGEFYYKFQFKDKSSNALISQIKTIDCKRLIYRMGKTGEDTLSLVKEKIRNMFS